MHSKHSLAGYSLMGMAILLTLLGIMAVTFVQMYNVRAAYEREDRTARVIQEVQTALNAYAQQNGNYPCPASLTAQLDTPEFGQSADCASASFDGVGPDGTKRDSARRVRIGAVPVRELGISDKSIVDAWNHRLVYAVTESMAVPGANIRSGVGQIEVRDADNNRVTADGAGVVYVVMSQGRDPRGAFNLNGNEVAACESPSGRGANCGTEAVFVNSIVRSTKEDEMFTPTFAYMANFAAYRWQQTPVGGGTVEAACAVFDCGVGGNVNFDVRCIDREGQEVNATNCEGTPPPTQQACPVEFCRWSPGPVTCAPACGPSTATIEAVCRDRAGNEISGAQADIRCDAGARPAPVTMSCMSTATCSYRWETTGWSECSETCGGGTRTRTASCLRENDNQTFADAFCAAIPAPALSEACNEEACPPPEPEYSCADLGTCPAEGEEESEPPTSTCFVLMEGGSIISSKVDPETGGWKMPLEIDYDSTSMDIVGRGHYRRTIDAFPGAMRSTFDLMVVGPDVRVIIYPQEDFKGQPILDVKGPLMVHNIWLKEYNPKANANLTTRAQPYPYSGFGPRKWSDDVGATVSNMYNWGAFSCDRLKHGECKGPYNSIQVLCEGAKHYEWRTGDWSCAPGGVPEDTRTISCVEMPSGNPVPNSNCTGTAPTTSRVNNACAGTEEEEGCQPIVNQTVAEARAAGQIGSTGPYMSPPETTTYSGQFDISCWDEMYACERAEHTGASQQEIDILCATMQSCYDNTRDALNANWMVEGCTTPEGDISDIGCDFKVAPRRTVVCEAKQYEWHTGAYGECSGSPRMQTRAVTCREAGTTSVVANSYCTGTPPAASRSCAETYSWATGACNDGTRPVTCQSSSGQTVADSNCTGTKPSTTEGCTQECERTVTKNVLIGLRPLTYGWGGISGSQHGDSYEATPNAIPLSLQYGYNNALPCGSNNTCNGLITNEVHRYREARTLQAVDLGTGADIPGTVTVESLGWTSWYDYSQVNNLVGNNMWNGKIMIGREIDDDDNFNTRKVRFKLGQVKLDGQLMTMTSQHIGQDEYNYSKGLKYSGHIDTQMAQQEGVQPLLGKYKNAYLSFVTATYDGQGRVEYRTQMMQPELLRQMTVVENNCAPGGGCTRFTARIPYSCHVEWAAEGPSTGLEVGGTCDNVVCQGQPCSAEYFDITVGPHRAPCTNNPGQQCDFYFHQMNEKETRVCDVGSTNAADCPALGVSTTGVYGAWKFPAQQGGHTDYPPQPVWTLSCEAQTTYAWATGGWSECVNATRHRTVRCQSSSGQTVNDSNCTGTRPAGSENCGSAGTTFDWITGDWGACSNGLETRMVRCMTYANGQPAGFTSDNMCNIPSRPQQTRACTGTGGGCTHVATCTVRATRFTTRNGTALAGGTGDYNGSNCTETGSISCDGEPAGRPSGWTPSLVVDYTGAPYFVNSADDSTYEATLVNPADRQSATCSGVRPGGGSFTRPGWSVTSTVRYCVK